jgi:hypothetical protein
MTRMSKQGKKRHVSPRRPRPPSPKTGSKKDNLEQGFKLHENSAPAALAGTRFIPKIG